jgi:glutathionylspermidine synthase
MLVLSFSGFDPKATSEMQNCCEGFIRQAFASLPNFAGQYPVLGSWLIDHTPCGLSIREDENPITGNTSRFLPHAIL